MGADALVHGISLKTERPWFTVRQSLKGRGTNKPIEGASVQGRRVLLVDDVVTTGSSLSRAVTVVKENGAELAMVIAVVGRSRSLPTRTIFTYEDLGIPAIEDEAR